MLCFYLHWFHCPKFKLKPCIEYMFRQGYSILSNFRTAPSNHGKNFFTICVLYACNLIVFGWWVSSQYEFKPSNKVKGLATVNPFPKTCNQVKHIFCSNLKVFWITYNDANDKIMKGKWKSHKKQHIASLPHIFNIGNLVFSHNMKDEVSFLGWEKCSSSVN